MARVDAEQWRERVNTWQSSGKTAAAFASSRGFDARQLQWWKWKLGKQDGMPRASRRAFVPVHVEGAAPARAPAGVDLTFASGLVVRVPADFSPRAVAELIEVIGALSC